MGIFNRIKRNKKVEGKKENCYNLEKILQEGEIKHLKLTYFISKSRHNTRYNKIELEMNTKVVEKSFLGGAIYLAKVQWSQEDKESRRSTLGIEWKETILLGVEHNDFNDPEYIKQLMEGLLEYNRVEGLIKEGLNENPETPCGNYIGELRKNEEGQYEELFNLKLGRRVHNSQTMVDKRKEYERLKEQMKRNCQIESGERIN